MEAINLLDDFTTRLEQDVKERDGDDAQVLQDWLRAGGWDTIKNAIDGFLNKVVKGTESSADLKIRRFDEAKSVEVQIPKYASISDLEHQLSTFLSLPLGTFGFVPEKASISSIPSTYTVGDLVARGEDALRIYPIGDADWYLLPDETFHVPVLLEGKESSRIVTVTATKKSEVHHVWLEVSKHVKIQYDWKNDMGDKKKLYDGTIGSESGSNIYRRFFWNLWDEERFALPVIHYQGTTLPEDIGIPY